MPITGSLLKLVLRYTWQGQNCENVGWYAPNGAAFVTATMEGVLEAYWNDIKAGMRAILTDFSAIGQYQSILGTEYGGGNSYAEFAIPVDEKTGTRSTAGLGEAVTGILAVGARMTVGTRLTKPGQKRLPFLYEADISNNALNAPILALAETAFQTWSQDRILGAPVATGVLKPQVVRPLAGLTVPTVFQPITGQIVNTDITSQVSRKKGHGS
jgi:hypothetical protein